MTVPGLDWLSGLSWFALEAKGRSDRMATDVQWTPTFPNELFEVTEVKNA